MNSHSCSGEGGENYQQPIHNYLILFQVGLEYKTLIDFKIVSNGITLK